MIGEQKCRVCGWIIGTSIGFGVLNALCVLVFPGVTMNLFNAAVAVANFRLAYVMWKDRPSQAVKG